MRKRNKFLDLARELKIFMEHEGDGEINFNWFGTIPHRIDKGTGRFGNKRISGGHPNYRILKIGQNTEKSPGNLRSLAATQT